MQSNLHHACKSRLRASRMASMYLNLGVSSPASAIVAPASSAGRLTNFPGGGGAARRSKKGKSASPKWCVASRGSSAGRMSTPSIRIPRPSRGCSACDRGYSGQAIRAHQWSSEAIRAHQKHSDVIRGHLWYSATICTNARDNPTHSEVLTFVAGSYTKKGSSTVEVRTRASTAPRTSHVRSATITSLSLPEARRAAS